MDIIQSLPTVEQTNPYTTSTLLAKLKKNLDHHRAPRIAFFDIDSTMTINKPRVTEKVRKRVEAAGYAVCFVTSRTEESITSQEMYELSPELTRPAPHMGYAPDGTRVYIDPKDNKELAGTIDPDVICGTTGTTIYLKQVEGGYKPDIHYLRLMKSDPHLWRRAISKLLEAVYSVSPHFRLLPIEFEENYYKLTTDVYPPDHRIQVEFDSLQAKNDFPAMVKAVTHEMKPTIPLTEYEIIRDLRITDDSNPQKQRISVYLTPHAGYKAKATHQVVTQAVDALQVPIDWVEILLAGDSFPDVSMGLYGGLGAKATFLLVGGSRMTPYLTNNVPDFLGEKLQSIHKNLSPMKRKGFYTFSVAGYPDRTVVFLDEAYPGTTGPESILAYLQDNG